MSSALLSKTEVAARLRRHPRTIASYAAKGELRGIWVGNALRFEEAEVEAYLRRDSAAVIDAYVERLVASAPALSETQRSRLAGLLQQPVGAA